MSQVVLAPFLSPRDALNTSAVVESVWHSQAGTLLGEPQRARCKLAAGGQL